MDMCLNDDFEWVNLPSHGECYPVDSPLRCGKVAMRHLTASDEDFIHYSLLHDGGERLADALVEKKVVDGGIDTTCLCRGDRDALVLWLRRDNCGDKLTVSIANVGEKNEKWVTTIDLNDIGFRNFDLISDDLGNFTYFMKNGDILKFKFLSVGDILDIYGSSVENDGDDSLHQMLKMATVSVNSDTCREHISDYIDNLNTDDAVLYGAYIGSSEPSLETRREVTIPDEFGGGVVNIDLLIGSGLFFNT